MAFEETSRKIISRNNANFSPVFFVIVVFKFLNFEMWDDKHVILHLTNTLPYYFVSIQ